MKTLVIAAHSDDEVLGMGGTIPKLENVDILILSGGLTSRLNFIENSYSLQEAAMKAGKLLNVNNLYIEKLPDQRFDNLDFLDLVQLIESYIKKIKPDIIYTHDYLDLNLDHRLTYQAVLTACRPMPNACVNEIYTFEIPSSSEWNFGQVFIPNTFVNITDTIKYKLEALQYYDSEMRKFPHPRSYEGIENLAKQRGSQVGCEYAEAFKLIRRIVT